MAAKRKTVNVKLRDDTLAHLIDLHRLANSHVREALSLLRAADVALYERLVVALQRMGDTAFSVQRLTSLLSGVWEANEAAYRQISVTTQTHMRELTQYEIQHQQSLFNEALPAPVGQRLLITLDAQVVYAAAAAKPFQGHLMSDWFGRLAANRQDRIQRSLATGFVSGDTIDQMIATLRGTRANNYADGLLEIDRQHAESVVRTATSHTANFARQAFYKSNSDIIREEQWVSTLDNRTTEICQIRDGKLYTAGDHEPVGHKVPWLEGPGAIHWNCRSTSVPVVDSAQELGIELPPLERAAMDGVAAPDTNYKDWIESQSAARQDDILGPTRGALLRRGGISFERFFNDKGSFLTLDELRKKDAAAFRRANV